MYERQNEDFKVTKVASHLSENLSVLAGRRLCFIVNSEKIICWYVLDVKVENGIKRLCYLEH